LVLPPAPPNPGMQRRVGIRNGTRVKLFPVAPRGGYTRRRRRRATLRKRRRLYESHVPRYAKSSMQ
jgi:hypothetical protein